MLLLNLQQTSNESEYASQKRQCGGREIATDISKKDAAALSAAIAVYLAKPRTAEKAPAGELSKTLEPLLKKVTELEKRIDELNSSVNRLREKVERIEKR